MEKIPASLDILDLQEFPEKIHSQSPPSKSSEKETQLAEFLAGTKTVNNLDDLPKKYDVFISFRGKDTRSNIVSHLYNALMKIGIKTYIDDRLERGKEISKAPMDAIEESKFCVVVFSKNYASSSWCLDELVQITRKHMEEKNFIVLPVFYDVSPSDVQKQKRSYEDAFVKNQQRFDEDQIKKWRVALTTAANLSGWDTSEAKNYAEVVDGIIEFIRRKMDEAILDYNKLKTNPSGPVVSVSIDVLLKKISSGVVRFLRGTADSDFGRLLDKIEATVVSLAEVLSDAEQKQIRNPEVEKWLDKLQDVVEDAEDLFGEIEYDALKLKVELESEPDKSEVSKFFSSFNLTKQKRKSDLEKILERLDTFENQMYILDLRADSEKIQSQGPPSISFIDDSIFLGRDEEKKTLKGMLLSDNVDSEKICVIPIVGMGGIGKTTLAQAVYNDDEVNKHFELKTWVCVSDECKLTKAVLEAVTREGCVVEDSTVLQEKLQEILDEKKFLIILDDVWSEEFWETLRMLFKVGAQGSKIIVTTRSERVATMVGTKGSFHLDVLKEEVCMDLFVKIVSGNKELRTTDSNLEMIGKEFVKKCKGLPLAVKVVASLLRFTNVSEWMQILESEILDLPVGETNILPALRLSYHYLPAHLKRCFVYCSMFPRDYEYVKDELVLLWMADNLLEHSSGNKSMKEVGYEYFDDLVSRSFLQPAKGTYKSRDIFVMHHLMVDLATFVSKKKFLYIEKKNMYDIGQIRQMRHLAIDVFVDHADFHETCKLISEATYLRTFAHVNRNPFFSNTILQDDVLKDFMKLGRLRYLSLAGYQNVVELPNSVGELRHLRHLDLSRTSIKELPKSVCSLYNLQILNLTSCMHLTKLPENLHHLINLTNLYMSKCRFCSLPPLGQLPALLTLAIKGCHAVEMVGVDFYGTGSAKSFPLLESLTFKKMKNWKKWSAPKGNVEAFPKLTSLTIHECEKLVGDLPCLLPSLTEFDVLYCPVLASSLPVMPTVSRVWVMQCAKIGGFKSVNSLQNFVNLEDLCLRNCYNIDFLPPSNYESLQKLFVENISCSLKILPLDSFPKIREVKVCDCENLESFSLLNSLNSLFTLSIEDCPNFTFSSDSNLDCPILTELFIYSCNNLKFLPEKLHSLLPSLQVLIISDCPELESLPRYGLPISLRELTITSCEKLIASRKNWNLQELVNLASLSIKDYQYEDMESFLEQGLLPTSLTALTIEDIACLKTLDEKGFQELTSLKGLHISRCPKLQSLPVRGLPPSFEGLLPPSFESFFIDDCPLLEAKYEGRRKICCIPRVYCEMPKKIQALEPSSLQLVFTKNPLLPIFTRSTIQAVDGNPLEIQVVDKSGDQMVPLSVPHRAIVEIIPLDGDFPSSDDSWTSDQFDKKIIREMPLLDGNLTVMLRDGKATIGELEFTDNSSWVRSRKFRIGARLVPETDSLGLSVREALTEAFVVKDHRGELNKKHHPPKLEDEVWKLEKISKEGVLHRRLADQNIHTVQDFLKLSVVDTPKLRKILGIMSETMWKGTLSHAETCEMGNKMYIYRPSQLCTIFLNPICQAVKAEINGEVYGSQELSNNRAYFESLEREAYAKWNSLEVLADVTVTQGERSTDLAQYHNQGHTLAIKPFEHQIKDNTAMLNPAGFSVPRTSNQKTRIAQVQNEFETNEVDNQQTVMLNPGKYHSSIGDESCKHDDDDDDDDDDDMRDLEDLLYKLNPMAEKFVPAPAFVGYAGNALMHNKNSANARNGHKLSDATIRRTVYVSNIDHQVTEENIAALFMGCGEVVDCRVCGDPNSVLRFAFVEFTDEEGARAALNMSGIMLGYYPVTVLPSKTAIAPVNPTFLPKSDDERQLLSRTIYCTNIDKKVTQADVKLFFESICGEVQRLRLLGDRHHSTRIAFVEFTMAESAIAALNCSGVVLGTLPIRVSPSKTPIRPRARHPTLASSLH